VIRFSFADIPSRIVIGVETPGTVHHRPFFPRRAAAAIRSQQPLAVLANSGTAHIDYNWLEFQRNRGLLEHLDALCVHPYTNNSTPSQEVGPEKGKVYEKLTQLNDIVDAAGGMKQLWSTEYGWPNSSRPNGEHDRADLYVREMIVGDMAGLDINGLYTWDRDYGIVGRPAGGNRRCLLSFPFI